MSGERWWRSVCLSLAGLLWLLSASAALPGGTAADLVPLGVGALLGAVLAGSQRHPVRRFAAVPFGCTLLAAAVAWCVFLREGFEQIVEFLLWPCYRIRLHGPGARCVPERGPLLVIANHASWLDPVWLIKALPRRLTPLMTSIYFDRPVLRWLMT